MRTISSLKYNEVIVINSIEEYDEIALLLDNAGKRWAFGEKYTEWSPTLFPNLLEGFPMYIMVFKGIWGDVFDGTYTYIPASEFLEKKLPKYWVVDISKDRERGRNTVVKYLRMVYKTKWGGTLNFYGYDGNAHCKGTNGYDYIKGFINNPVLLTIDEFISYPEVIEVLGLDKNPLTNKQMKDKRFPFAITMDKAKRIMAVVCPEWQERLGKLWGKNLLIYGYVEVSEELYKEGRKVANAKVNQVLDEIFGKDEQKITYEDVMKSFETIYYIEKSGNINSRGGYGLGSDGINDPNNTYSANIHKRQQAQLKIANVARYLNKDKIDQGFFIYLRDGKIGYGVCTSSIGEPVVYFKTRDLAEQAVEILGEETVKLACQPLND